MKNSLSKFLCSVVITLSFLLHQSRANAQGSWALLTGGIGDSGLIGPSEARDGSSALSIGGKVWVIGFDSLQIFDPIANSWWTPLTANSYIPGSEFFDSIQIPGQDDPNSGRRSGTAAIVNSKIYCFGGFHYIDNAYSSSNGFHLLDTMTLFWSKPQTSGSFTSRQDLISAVVDGKIYAIGGNADTNLSENTLFSTVEIFDPSTSTWSTPVTNGSLIPAEGQCGCAFNGKIYVFGGAQSGSNSLILTPNQVFDPSTSTWSLISSKGMFGRWYASACALNGKIYLVGGQAIGPDTQGSWFNDTALAGTGNDGTQRYIQIYDPTTDSWSTPYTSGTFDGVFMAAATVFNGKIYVFGGDNGEITNEVQVFTPGSDDVNEQKIIDDLSLYPSPTTGLVTITGASGPVEVENVLGENVLSANPHANTPQPPPSRLRSVGEGVTLDLLRLPAGTYFVRVQTADGEVVQRLVKQ